MKPARILTRLLPALIGGGLPAGVAHAQLAPDSARLALKVSVSHLLQATYGAEAEYRCTRALSFVLAPRLVAGTVPARISATAHRDGDQVRGYSLSLGPRYYLPNTGTEGARLAGAYFALRADYQRLNLSYHAEVWGEEQGPNGLLYYTFRPRQQTEAITRYGGAVTLGYQCQVFSPRLRLDVSASLNRLLSSSSAGPTTRYHSSPRDYLNSSPFWSLEAGLGFVINDK